MSKLGIASRTQAAKWVLEGRVRVNGRIVRDPEYPVLHGRDSIALDGREMQPAKRRVVMLNKPRGLVTTAADEKGRHTVYRCFDGSNLPWLAPVGRLDKASEGLLLFTNDPAWAARVCAPEAAVEKIYHVQIDRLPDARLLAQLESGVAVEAAPVTSATHLPAAMSMMTAAHSNAATHLAVKTVRCLRRGEKNAWLEVVLEEGRNRQIRRLLAALDVTVLRLLRVAVGALSLADLAKGQWRELTEAEIDGVRAFLPGETPDVRL